MRDLTFHTFKAGCQEDHASALPAILWMVSQAVILNHAKTAFGQTDEDVRKWNEWGFPSLLDPCVRTTWNTAAVLLQEPCPAFHRPRVGADRRGQQDAGKSAP